MYKYTDCNITYTEADQDRDVSLTQKPIQGSWEGGVLWGWSLKHMQISMRFYFPNHVKRGNDCLDNFIGHKKPEKYKLIQLV